MKLLEKEISSLTTEELWQVKEAIKLNINSRYGLMGVGVATDEYSIEVLREWLQYNKAVTEELQRRHTNELQ